MFLQFSITLGTACSYTCKQLLFIRDCCMNHLVGTLEHLQLETVTKYAITAILINLPSQCPVVIGLTWLSIINREVVLRSVHIENTVQ